MTQAACWFAIMAIIASCAPVAGWWLSRKSAVIAWALLLPAMLGLAAASWLTRHPTAWLNLLPASSIQYLEGTLAVPFMMFVLGIAWSKACCLRQRAIIVLSGSIAAAVFLQGGLWMVQPSTAGELAQANRLPYVMQSRSYSCVPAAAATALNMLGFESTEAQMAQLTHTRPGRGATGIRAVAGLQERLAGSGIAVRMVDVQVSQLALMETPILLTVNFDRSRLNNHMIVILHGDAQGAQVLDPTDGQMYMPWSALEDAKAGTAIIFERRDIRQAMAATTSAPSWQGVP